MGELMVKLDNTLTGLCVIKNNLPYPLFYDGLVVSTTFNICRIVLSNTIN